VTGNAVDAAWQHREMEPRVVVVLPADAGAPAARPLAAGVALAGARLGVVDNGLWRSMPTIVATVGVLLREEGSPPLTATPFDHLAPEFDAQQAALGPFAGEVDGALAGLGA